MAVGQRIKELRKVSKLTQQQLAEGVVTRSYISQIEKGLIQPSYDTLEKLAARLNCTVEEFFKEPENLAMQVAEIKKKIGQADGLAEAGDLKKAEKVLQGVDDCSSELNDYDLGVLAFVRGRLSIDAGENDKAIELYQQSVTLLDDYPKELLRSHMYLAMVFLQLDEIDKARSEVFRAYDIAAWNRVGGMSKVQLLVLMGEMHFLGGELHSALYRLREAKEIGAVIGVKYQRLDALMLACQRQIYGSTAGSVAMDLVH